MQFWHAIILGLVQGFGEFLPISSSGHLVLIRELFGINGDFLFFDVMMHMGTLIAICVVFFKDLVALFKPPFKTIGYLAVASVPAVLVAVLFQDKIEGFFSNGKYLCFFFLFTAILMFVTEIISKKIVNPKPISLVTAVSMGIMQGVAVFPGISRSGSTIFGGILAKGERTEVAKFSFFMSIPVILGSVILQSFKITSMTEISVLNILLGIVFSFASGMLSIKIMMKLIAKADYKWFSLYLVIISILSFVFIFLKA